MRKKLGICLNIIILLLCLFPCISFGKYSTVVKLSVYEVTINCEENGSLLVGDNKYTKTHKTFVGYAENLCVKIIPNKGYEVEYIEGTSGCDITFNSGQLDIKNIRDNIVINIKFKAKLENEVISTLIPNTNITPTTPDNPNENIIINEVELKPTDNDNEYSYGKGKLLIKILKENDIEFIGLLDKENVIKNVLSQNELEAVREGETITIHLEIKLYKNEDNVPKEEKTLIDDFINKYSHGKNKLIKGIYIDVKLYKMTSNGERKYVYDIEKPIHIVFKVPGEISFKDTKYYIVHTNEGKATLLKDLDNNNNTITINTNRFSTYLIVYNLKQCCLCWIFWLILVIILAITIYLIKKKNS